MLFRQKLFAVLAALFLMALIFELVRRRKLKEEYSWLWMLTGGLILLLVLWYDLLLFLSRLIGAIAPTTALFLAGFLLLILINLHFSIRISTMSSHINILAQELAILKEQIKNNS